VEQNRAPGGNTRSNLSVEVQYEPFCILHCSLSGTALRAFDLGSSGLAHALLTTDHPCTLNQMNQNWTATWIGYLGFTYTCMSVHCNGTSS
jgi:hypothetical protein